ncbi:hypothetical protein GJAV_G00236060 [Gymnothorax javanicus]|nr:hypothetical protein GJAV_G00236060 [Gymnothorax javanicus]
MFLLCWSIKRKHCDNYFDYWGKGTKVTVSSGISQIVNCGFDYWGKGTKVTVTSGESKRPSVFPLVSCVAGSDGYVTLGCIAKGFSPDDLTFKWTHKGKTLTTEFLQYPSIQTDGNFMAVSLAKVKASNRANGDTYECSTDPQGTPQTVQVSSVVTLPPPPKSASLIVMIPSQEELKQNKNATFACLARDKTESVTNSLPECSADKVQVSIIPPSNEKLLLEHKVEVQCVVTGDMENIDSVKWQTEDHKTLVSTEDTDGQSKTLTLSIKYDDWANGTLYRCVVKHFDKAEPIEKRYKRDNGNGQKRPSVYLMTPDDKANGDSVTLICAAKGFYPKEVLFSWNADDTHVERPKFYTSQVVETDQGYSAFSQLTVSAAEWEKGIMYSCAVHHEAAPNMAKTLVRTIDRISKRSTSISFDTCLSAHRTDVCYNQWDCESTDPEDDCAADTAIAFIFLFLITLFYSIGATAIKVK